MTNKCPAPFVQEAWSSQFGIEPRGNCLFYGEQQLTNFRIDHAIALCSLEDPELVEAIQLQVHPSATPIHTVVLDLKKGSLIRQLLDQLPACRLFVPSAAPRLDACFLELAEQGRDWSLPMLYFRKNGLHRLWNGEWAMACGDEVLCDCDGFSPALAPTLSSLHLAWDPQLSENEAIERQIRQMEANAQTVQIAFGFTLLSSLRSEIMRRGFSTFPVLSVLGTQNFGKTVLVTRQCLLYDDTSRWKAAAKLEPISSELGLIHEMSQFCDQVVLVDDLAKGSHAAVERQRLKMMANLLRYAANDSERRTASPGKSTTLQECSAGVAFTGELPFTAPSDQTRILQIVLRKPLRNGTPEDRTVAATAFRAWVQWFLPRLEQQFTLLYQRRASEPPVEQARLQTTYLLMHWVLTSFYQFARERGVIGEVFFQSAVQSAKETLLQILQVQADLTAKGSQSAPKGNLSWYIRQGYCNDAFTIVSRKKIKSSKDCVVEDGALCIRTSALKDYLAQTPYGGMSRTAIGDRLEQEGVLPPIRAAKEVRRAKKKIHGKRYLEIPLNLLSSAAQRY